MIKILTDNTPKARFIRTLIQALLGAIIALVSYFEADAPAWFSTILAPAIMCVLSPLMAQIKEFDEGSEDE